MTTAANRLPAESVQHRDGQRECRLRCAEGPRAIFRSSAQKVHGKNAGLPRQCRHVAEAAGGHRRDPRYYEQDNANIHRGVHFLSERATEEYEAARQDRCRSFLNAGRRERDHLCSRHHGSHQSGGADLRPRQCSTPAMKC